MSYAKNLCIHTYTAQGNEEKRSEKLIIAAVTAAAAVSNATKSDVENWCKVIGK